MIPSHLVPIVVSRIFHSLRMFDRNHPPTFFPMTGIPFPSLSFGTLRLISATKVDRGEE